MKTLCFKTALVVVLTLAAGFSLRAQTLREEDQKDFTAIASTELSIDNQFGNITVADWDQNKVAITYIIEVTYADEAKAKKVMEKIKVEFKEEGSRILVKTVIGELGNLNLHNKKDEKQSFRIDYFVKCPKGIKINLDNQFGDMIVGSFTGPFSADLQFGNLNAVSLGGTENKIDMQFGEVTIGSMKDGKIDIQHCDVLKITECGNLSIDAQFTKVDIGSAVSLKADLNNCELNVDALADHLKLDANMGNTKIGSVAAGFTSLSVEQNMGDLTIGIDPKAGYKLNAEVNMGSLKVPEGMKVSKEKESDLPGVTVEKISGVFGSGNSTVKLNVNMGSVKIK